MQAVTVSIIVPAYNEQATIVELLTEVRKQAIEGVQFEVIVVDDGSTDSTGELLEKNPSLYDRLIKQPKNSGKGAAVLAGLQNATGQYILFQDADLEYSPSHYKTLLHPVREFGADIVIGSRFMAAQYVRVQFFWHKMGNMLITTVFNLLFNTTFTDIYTCYLLYRRELVDPHTLRTRGWEQHAEILCHAVRRAKVIYEVPISYHGRSYDEGKKITPASVIPVFFTILRCRFFG
jgi:glycosyltransferase involved in cell wall biosynthesis